MKKDNQIKKYQILFNLLALLLILMSCSESTSPDADLIFRKQMNPNPRPDTLIVPNIIEIILPAHSIDIQRYLEIRNVANPPQLNDNDYSLGKKCFNVKLEGKSSFAQPLTITMYYDPTEIPSGMTAKNAIVGIYYDGNSWLNLPTTIDESTKKIIVTSDKINHFSYKIRKQGTSNWIKSNWNNEWKAFSKAEVNSSNWIFAETEDKTTNEPILVNSQDGMNWSQIANNVNRAKALVLDNRQGFVFIAGQKTDSTWQVYKSSNGTTFFEYGPTIKTKEIIDMQVNRSGWLYLIASPLANEGKDDTKIFVSYSGTSWEELTYPDNDYTYQLNRIAINRTGRIYISGTKIKSGTNSATVINSSDAYTFQELSTGLETSKWASQISINSMNWLYIWTDKGIYINKNNYTWQNVFQVDIENSNDVCLTTDDYIYRQMSEDQKGYGWIYATYISADNSCGLLKSTDGTEFNSIQLPISADIVLCCALNKLGWIWISAVNSNTKEIGVFYNQAP